MRDQRNIDQLRKEIADLTQMAGDPSRAPETVRMLVERRQKKQIALDMLLKQARK